MSLSPGDPATLAAQPNGNISSNMSQQAYEIMKKDLMLDKPIYLRYWYWLAGQPASFDDNGKVLNKDRSRGVLFLDFGKAMSPDRRAVSRKIFNIVPRAEFDPEGEMPFVKRLSVYSSNFFQSRFWATMSLAILAIGSSLLFAVPIGIIQASRQDGVFDKLTSTSLYALYSIPSYVMALPLILIFSTTLKLLPFQGMRSDNFADLTTMGKFADLAKHYVLITICSSYGAWAYYSRFVRQNMLEVQKLDYVRTAIAKGLSEKTVIIKHIFRNTLIPLATLMGMILPGIVGGSVILETIFSWPGLGRLMYDSIMQRDYTTVMALTVISTALVLLGNLLADLSYSFIDPRIKNE